MRTCLDVSFVCGGADCGLLDYSETEGMIMSPRYPEQYPSKMNCTYAIKSPAGSTVTIIFDVFDVEFHEDCGFDYLAVSSLI